MSDARVFVDTNVIVRHLIQDPPEQAIRATALFRECEAGSVRLVATETVVFETVFVLDTRYHVPRPDIARMVSRLLSLPGIELAGRADVFDALEYWISRPGLSFADCLHIFNARRMTGGRISSFDRKIGTAPGITRLEP